MVTEVPPFKPRTESKDFQYALLCQEPYIAGASPFLLLLINMEKQLFRSPFTASGVEKTKQCFITLSSAGTNCSLPFYYLNLANR